MEKKGDREREREKGSERIFLGGQVFTQSLPSKGATRTGILVAPFEGHSQFRLQTNFIYLNFVS